MVLIEQTEDDFRYFVHRVPVVFEDMPGDGEGELQFCYHDPRGADLADVRLVVHVGRVEAALAFIRAAVSGDVVVVYRPKPEAVS